jgi:prolyl-tRNA synthetase
MMGVITEIFSDEKGLVWPEVVAPFKFHILEISSKNSEVKKVAERIYEKLNREEKESALYDDRDARAGEKFADADLLGMPYQIIVSEKNLEIGKLELKKRATGEVKMISEDELQNLV